MAYDGLMIEYELTHTDTQDSAHAIRVYVVVDHELGATAALLDPNGPIRMAEFAREAASVGEGWYLAETIAPDHAHEPVEFVFMRD